MYILGVSAFFHDSAACLIKNGEIIAAAQEERFSRKKHDSSFPFKAIKFCLDFANISIDQVTYIGFYEKTHLKFERILSVGSQFFPKGFNTFEKALSSWINGKLWIPEIIRQSLFDLSPSQGKEMLWDGKLIFAEHHMSHAASAFYPSPFDEAAILTLDGVGEWASSTIAIGKNNERNIPQISFLKEINYPDSLGMFYSAITSYLGFKVNSGEYKVMGLAPYGEPKYVDLILKELIDVKKDGSYKLNFNYFTFPYSEVMINEEFCKLFEMPIRKSEDLLTQKHFDIAASLQHVTTLIIANIADYIHKETKMRNLCMAGGVALNCVANGAILKSGKFDDIWIQPAAGDAGGAVGVAFYIWHDVLKSRKNKIGISTGEDLMKGAYLGPSYTSENIKSILSEKEIPYSEFEENDLIRTAANILSQEKVIGWFQGRMEFGPRALGARSIIGDSRSAVTQKTMNLKIKYRESFRPFAPSVLREKVADYFDINGKEKSLLGQPSGGYDSPYMLMVASIKEDKKYEMSEEQKKLFGIDKLNVIRSVVPSCTHVDYSARIQTVHKKTNRKYYNLIEEYEKITGIPIIVNTSFNVRGEPIVCTPEDAINCFLGTEMDALILDNILIMKSEIPEHMMLDYKNKFALD